MRISVVILLLTSLMSLSAEKPPQAPPIRDRKPPPAPPVRIMSYAEFRHACEHRQGFLFVGMPATASSGLWYRLESCPQLADGMYQCGPNFRIVRLPAACPT
jgi:hypothetical protein